VEVFYIGGYGGLNSERHPKATWETFTTAFLWCFKPEWRHIIPLMDEDIELVNESFKYRNII